jgi:hypothetical protein
MGHCLEIFGLAPVDSPVFGPFFWRQKNLGEPQGFQRIILQGFFGPDGAHLLPSEIIAETVFNLRYPNNSEHKLRPLPAHHLPAPSPDNSLHNDLEYLLVSSRDYSSHDYSVGRESLSRRKQN